MKFREKVKIVLNVMEEIVITKLNTYGYWFLECDAIIFTPFFDSRINQEKMNQLNVYITI